VSDEEGITRPSRLRKKRDPGDGEGKKDVNEKSERPN
jgi:hypothetical protein